MSQFIYDEIYGSQAKKQKIIANPNFIYYRTMMNLKQKHSENRTLFNSLYKHKQQENTETINSMIRNHSRNKSHKPQKQLFNMMYHNNYTIQKINPNSFKILKRKVQPLTAHTIGKSNNLLNLQNVNKHSTIGSSSPNKMNTTFRKLTASTIHNDAKQIRCYLQSTERKNRSMSNRSGNQSKLRNHSTQLPATPSIAFTPSKSRGMSRKYQKHFSQIEQLQKNLTNNQQTGNSQLFCKTATPIITSTTNAIKIEEQE